MWWAPKPAADRCRAAMRKSRIHDQASTGDQHADQRDLFEFIRDTGARTPTVKVVVERRPLRTGRVDFVMIGMSG